MAPCLSGAFGTMTPLQLDHRARYCPCCCASASALAPAFKMRFWNIGAEGQILIGGIATAACHDLLRATICHCRCCLLAMAIGSIAAGALWGFIPALVQGQLEHQRDAVHPDDELRRHVHCLPALTNIMGGPRRSSPSASSTRSTKAGWFPVIVRPALHALNIIVVIVLTVVMYVYLQLLQAGL